MYLFNIASRNSWKSYLSIVNQNTNFHPAQDSDNVCRNKMDDVCCSNSFTISVVLFESFFGNTIVIITMIILVY